MNAILLTGTHVEEVTAIHADVLHHDVIALRQGHVLSVTGLIKLSPRTHNKETTRTACHVLHTDVFIMLRSVRTHLEPEYAVGIVCMAMP